MAIFQFAFCMFTRPGTSRYIPGICEAELRKAFQKSEGLLLRVMGLRASTSAANADGSSNEETRVLMHLDQVGAAGTHGELGIHPFDETSTSTNKVPQNKCITEPEVSGWYNSMYLLVSSGSTLKF